MKNILNFISFIFETAQSKMRLGHSDPLEVVFTPHALLRMSWRDDDDEQARWRKITLKEGEDVVRSQKGYMIDMCRTNKPNSSERDRDKSEWHFSIKIESDRFGYMLQGTNFMVAMKEDFRKMSWVATVKTFKIQDNWADRPRDWVITL